MGLTEAEMMECLMDPVPTLYSHALSMGAKQVERELRASLRSLGHDPTRSATQREQLDQLLILLIGALRSGELTPAVRNLIANFIVDVFNSDDEVVARRLLGLPARKRGHPNSDLEVRWDRASSVYLHYIEKGCSETEALHMTWEAYFVDKDAKTEQKTAASRKNPPDETMYEAQIRQLKTMLNRDLYRTRARPGRKNITKAKSPISIS